MRLELADRAIELAVLADRTADILEASARRGDAVRRMTFATWERETAVVARRNAERLRQGAGVAELDRLPPRPPELSGLG
jgi:hypothetical protein